MRLWGWRWRKLHRGSHELSLRDDIEHFSWMKRNPTINPRCRPTQSPPTPPLDHASRHPSGSKEERMYRKPCYPENPTSFQGLGYEVNVTGHQSAHVAISPRRFLWRVRSWSEYGGLVKIVWGKKKREKIEQRGRVYMRGNGGLGGGWKVTPFTLITTHNPLWDLILFITHQPQHNIYIHLVPVSVRKPSLDNLQAFLDHGERLRLTVASMYSPHSTVIPPTVLSSFPGPRAPATTTPRRK